MLSMEQRLHLLHLNNPLNIEVNDQSHYHPCCYHDLKKYLFPPQIFSCKWSFVSFIPSCSRQLNDYVDIFKRILKVLFFFRCLLYNQWEYHLLSVPLLHSLCDSWFIVYCAVTLGGKNLQLSVLLLVGL